jgi:hypothetical protein
MSDERGLEDVIAQLMQTVGAQALLLNALLLVVKRTTPEFDAQMGQALDEIDTADPYVKALKNDVMHMLRTLPD